MTTARRPKRVPYIASWSREQRAQVPVVARPDGIGFPTEVPADRDPWGVLWALHSPGRGKGRPQYNIVHPRRQRESMLGMLCQICGKPADHNDTGWLWLLHDDRAIESPGWPESVGASHPPLCLPCARESTETCPHLHAKFIAVRVREAPVVAVRGLLYTPRLHTPRPGSPCVEAPKDVIMRYSDPAVRWVLAAQMMRLLTGCTVVDLDRQ